MFLRVSLRFRDEGSSRRLFLFLSIFLPLLVFHHPPPPEEGGLELIKSHEQPQHRRKSVSRAWKMAENLIFRIKNIEIQNQFLPWPSSGGRVEKSLRVSFTSRTDSPIRLEPPSPTPSSNPRFFSRILFLSPRVAAIWHSRAVWISNSIGGPDFYPDSTKLRVGRKLIADRHLYVGRTHVRHTYSCDPAPL